jgi:hypothetical protein
MPSLSSALSAVSCIHPSYGVRTIDPSLFRDRLRRTHTARRSHSVLTGIFHTTWNCPFKHTGPTFKQNRYDQQNTATYVFHHSGIAGLPPQSLRHFCITTFSASLTNRTVLLPQSHDCSYYVSRQILTPPPLWLQNTLSYAHMTSRANVIRVWSCGLCGLTPALNFTLHHDGAHRAHNTVRILKPVFRYFSLMKPGYRY